MFELKHPSHNYQRDLRLAIERAPIKDLPCCMTRETMVLEALRVSTWEFGPSDTILVWLDSEGQHKVSLPCVRSER